MQLIISDRDLLPSDPFNPSGNPSPSTSRSPSPATTPSFTPNAPAPILSPSAVTVPAILSMLAKTEPGDEEPGEVDELDIPSDLDLSQPVSTLLKVGTMRAHVKAEHSEGAKALVQGRLAIQEYVRWMAVLWRIYSALELGLSEHSTHPVLAPTYDPALLSRAPAIAADITHLLTLLPSSTASSTASAPASNPSTPLPPFPVPAFLQPVFDHAPAPLSAYLSHLRFLATASSSAPSLLAHAYVRYLGDLSGGQYIGARIKKAYQLEGLDGTRFYQFDNREGEVEAESGADRKRKLREIKDWFRTGMDQGVGDDEQSKAHLIKEANLAFALNTQLFSLIRPSPSSSLVTRQADQAVQSPQRELRYFEKRELERKRREEERLLIEGPEVPNTWPQMIERFLLFGVTAVMGWFLSQVAVPFITKHVGPRLGGVRYGEL